MRHKKRGSKTRVVGYAILGPFDEGAMERLLGRAKRAGVATQYDTGRGGLAWFNGAPGAALREVREEAMRLVHTTH